MSVIVNPRDLLMQAAPSRLLPVTLPPNVVIPELVPDPLAPLVPTGFAVSAAISHIFIEHDAPTFTTGHGYARTNVYGALWIGGAFPVFANAVKITSFSGQVFAHATNPALVWHLWITWESRDGGESAPAGGINGLVATTGQDVERLVAAMTGPGNPFTILTVDTVVDGVTFPAGTYSSRAFIGDAQINRAKIKDLAVDSAKIADLAVGTAKIEDAAITRAKIDSLAVGSAEIDDLAVGTAKIEDAAITRAKIDSLAVGSAEIDDLAVGTAKIDDAAITTAKIDDLAVETLKIAGYAVIVPLFAGFSSGVYGEDSSITSAQWLEAGSSVTAFCTYSTAQSGFKFSNVSIYAVDAGGSLALMGSTATTGENVTAAAAAGYFTAPTDGYYHVVARVNGEAGGVCTSCTITATGAKR